MIITSIIESDNPQTDGRRWIHEIHTDDLGVVYERNYLTEADADAVTAMNNYAAQLNVDVQEQV